MRRRHALGAIAVLGTGAAIWRGAALAQAVAQRRLVCYLEPYPAGASAAAKIVLGELAKFGWNDGANIQFEARHGDNQPERIVALARELVAMKPALLLGLTTEVILALRKETDRIPIVGINFTNPVERGLAASLARPGGNVTGVVTMAGAYFPKLIEYARTVAPRARRIGYLINSANPNMTSSKGQDAVRGLATSRGFEMVFLPVRDAEDIEKAIRSMTPAGDYVLLTTQDALVAQHLARIAELARAARLPSVSAYSSWSRVGGLLTYGPDVGDNVKRAAQIADQILRGAKPGEIPIEQPTRIPLILNQRTASAIGIKFPNELLVRADEVID